MCNMHLSSFDWIFYTQEVFTSFAFDAYGNYIMSFFCFIVIVL